MPEAPKWLHEGELAAGQPRPSLANADMGMVGMFVPRVRH